MAQLARRLCTEDIHPLHLKEFISCRLIPLNKGPDSAGNPGVRPIGIGEVFRRIIGKSVVSLLKLEIQDAVGPLQTCTGLRSGIEASIHATKRIWHDDSTEAIIQVDADNAFNRLNRRVALHNIKQICPPIYTYLNNHYQDPARLIVNDRTENYHLFSEEGCTQGDVAAMAKYALGVKPLIDVLSHSVDNKLCKQAWYADDSTTGGKIEELKKWWDKICEMGPKYGYYPKASKTLLILKDETLLPYAREIFGETGMVITCEGHRHLGAVIGTEIYKERYVNEKVSKWIEDLKELSKVAVNEPQAALSAYTKGICHRWTFIQRTLCDTKELFRPLEETIREKFIPAIIGRKISDVERLILSLSDSYLTSY